MERLDELLRTPLYGSFDVRRAVFLVVAFLVLRFLYRVVRPKRSIVAAVTAKAACPCGWRGLASIHAPRCPRCGRAAFLE